MNSRGRKQSRAHRVGARVLCVGPSRERVARSLHGRVAWSLHGRGTCTGYRVRVGALGSGRSPGGCASGLARAGRVGVAGVEATRGRLGSLACSVCSRESRGEGRKKPGGWHRERWERRLGREARGRRRPEGARSGAAGS